MSHQNLQLLKHDLHQIWNMQTCFKKFISPLFPINSYLAKYWRLNPDVTVPSKNTTSVVLVASKFSRTPPSSINDFPGSTSHPLWSALPEIRLLVVVQTPLISLMQVPIVLEDNLPPQISPSWCDEWPYLGSGRSGILQEVFDDKSYNSAFMLVDSGSPPAIRRPINSCLTSLPTYACTYQIFDYNIQLHHQHSLNLLHGWILSAVTLQLVSNFHILGCILKLNHSRNYFHCERNLLE